MKACQCRYETDVASIFIDILRPFLPNLIEGKYFCDFFEWAQNLAMYRRRFRIPGIDDYQRVLDILGYISGSRLVAFRRQTAELSVSD